MTKLGKKIEVLVDDAKGIAADVVDGARSTADKIARKAHEDATAAEREFDRVSKVVGKKLKRVKNRI